MHRSIRSACAGLVAVALAAGLLAAPVAAAAPPARPAGGQTIGLGQVLGADGSFHGVPGVSGTVDARAWNLTTSLATGQAPRFTPAAAPVSPAAAATAGTWAAFGSDGAGNGVFAPNQGVTAIAVVGTDLYVGGHFTNLAGIPEADYIAKWDGSNWSALGSNGAGDGALNLWVNVLAVNGTDLYVGGDFSNAAGIATADNIAKWSGGAWSALGDDGTGDGAFSINAYVTALAVYNGDVYANAASEVTVAGGGSRQGLVRFVAGSWTDVGLRNLPADVLVVSGGLLYAGYVGVTTWNGSTWANVGPAYIDSTGGEVWALAVSGSTIYAGGTFRNAGGDPAADFIAKWNGSAWVALGSNLAGTDGAIGVGGYVYAVAASGLDVYVSGSFYSVAGNAAMNGIAHWNGSAWTALGSNTNVHAAALLVSGTDLLAGGGFINAGGVAEADGIAAWGMVPTPPGPTRKPDGRIRIGTGLFIGNNLYNTTGAGQSRTGSTTRGHVLTYGVFIQNDGTAADSFKVKATGSATTKYTVKYYRGTVDITAKVVAGTYKTPSLGVGASYLITAKVTVKWNATLGSSVTRLLTISSVASPAQKDAVKLIGKRK